MYSCKCSVLYVAGFNACYCHVHCCPLFMCCRLRLRRRIKYLLAVIVVWLLLRYFIYLILPQSWWHAHKLLAAVRRIYTSSSKLPTHWQAVLSLVQFQLFPTLWKISSSFFQSDLLYKRLIEFLHLNSAVLEQHFTDWYSVLQQLVFYCRNWKNAKNKLDQLRHAACCCLVVTNSKPLNVVFLDILVCWSLSSLIISAKWTKWMAEITCYCSLDVCVSVCVCAAVRSIRPV